MTTDEAKQELVRRFRPREEPTLGRHCILPHQHLAFIYQRQSSYEQKVRHVWSERDQDELVELAHRDGYSEELIYVEKRDLGISGSKTEKDRPGLAHLMSLVEQDRVESLWVVEEKRIYRDPGYVNADRLALLLREHKVAVCTPRRVFNLANDDDWDDFHEEMADSVKDSRYRTEKFRRTRQAKARCGLWCGTPVPAGYVVKKGDRESYDVFEPYLEHVIIVNKIIDAFIDAQGSSTKAARALSGVEFPFFPEELRYMQSRTSLRRSPKTTTGYRITASLTASIAHNAFYIGWGGYGGELLGERHHDAIVEESKFFEAFQLAIAKGKARGRAVHSEMLPLAGLLRCGNHGIEKRIASHGAEGRYVCDGDYRQGISEEICLDIKHEFLDTPIIYEVFRGLRSSGLLLDLKDSVVDDLRQEIDGSRLEQRKLKAGIRELEQRIENLKWQLGETRETDRIEVYWGQIRGGEERMSLLQGQLSQRRDEQLTNEDVASVANFLRQIHERWDEQPYGLQNRLLKQLLDKVVLRHTRQEVEAVIHWHTGMEQQLWISRPQVNSGRDRKWSAEEDILLKELWPSMSKEIITAALSGRSWTSISLRAHRVGLKRGRTRGVSRGRWRTWTLDEDNELARDYQSGVPLEQIALKLGRSVDAIECRASTRKVPRPGNAKFATKEVQWERLEDRVGRADPHDFIHSNSQCRGRGRRG